MTMAISNESGRIAGLYPNDRLKMNPALTEQAQKQTNADDVAAGVEPIRAKDTYARYLQQNYDCVKNGHVAISGKYLQECAGNAEKAKELEESLAYYEESRRSGYENAKANARSHGMKLVNYSESWSIDETGNITMITSTTVTSDTGTKGWRELQKEQRERLEEKKAAEKKAEKREKEAKMREELLEDIKNGGREKKYPVGNAAENKTSFSKRRVDLRA